MHATLSSHENVGHVTCGAFTNESTIVQTLGITCHCCEHDIGIVNAGKPLCGRVCIWGSVPALLVEVVKIICKNHNLHAVHETLLLSAIPKVFCHILHEYQLFDCVKQARLRVCTLIWPQLMHYQNKFGPRNKLHLIAPLYTQW